MTFDWQKPTAMMLGRWQPWHDGHTELFCRALSETGQVAILIRDVGGIIGRDAGAGRTNVQEDNPFSAQEAIANIELGLTEAGFENNKHYIIMMVPNIVDISFGRGVGYTFTEHDLGKSVENISATKIRAEMRAKGTL
jgi:nicotinamide mononucleotide adenylyltransferase